jgi:precorrin-6Y C5,15-methyltransferase (decarboxylating)
MLAQLDALRGTPTVVLASGDPNWYGLGATVSQRLPAAEFAVHPHASAFQLAAARLRWPLQHVATLSLHGRPVDLLHPHVLPGSRILALTSDAATLPQVAALLEQRGYGASVLTALENLGGPEERIVSGPARTFAAPVGALYVLAIDCVAEPDVPLLPAIPGLCDDAFVSDGQLTKREVRAATLAKLAPIPGGLLWDVGAGCGSIGIEWMRAAHDAGAIAFERDATRRAMVGANAAALGVPGLRIVGGDAPESLSGMPPPDAIFIGGGLTVAGLADACWAALKPGGRLVANAVTLEGEQALFALHRRLGGGLCRIAVDVLDTLGAHETLRPRLPVTQFWTTKP